MTSSTNSHVQSDTEEGTSQERDIPKLRVSDLAQSHFFQCDKHVKLTAYASGSRSEVQIRSTTLQHLQRGVRFEAELLDILGDAVVDHTHTSVEDSKQALRQAKVGQILYQLPLQVPEDFYGNQNAYRLRTFIPDFLWIREDPVTKARSIFVVDAKSSEAVSSSHQFQVASYGYLLSYIIKDIRNLQVDRLGGVWLPSLDKEPETFRIDLMLPKLRRFYSIELVNIINSRKLQWLYNAKCINCNFTQRCRKEAIGTWGAIPYMTERRVATFQKRAIDDIEDLATSLQKLQVKLDEDELADKLRSLSVTDTATSRLRSKELQPFEEAYKTKKPQFLGKPIVNMAKEVDHDIFLSIIIDPLFLRPCSYGIEVFDALGKGHTRHIRSISRDERDISKYMELGTMLVDDLTRILSNMEEIESRCAIFVPDNETNRALRKCLYDVILWSNPKYSISSATKENAMHCLLATFQDTQVLGIPGVKTYSTTMSTVSTGRVVIMQQLISSNVALGVPGYYTFADIARWMLLDERSEARTSTALDLLDGKAIFAHWLKDDDGKSDSVHDLVTAQIIWLHRILRRFRRLADDYVNSTGTDIYCLDCEPFVWPELQTFRSPLLGRLSFFKKLEAVGNSDSLRSARIADFCGDTEKSPDKFRLCFTGYKEHVSPVRKVKSLLACFDVIPEEAGTNDVPLQLLTDMLSVNTFKEYILVEDNPEGILEAIRFPDLLYRASQKVNDTITLVNIHHINENGLSLALQGYFKPLGLKRGSYYRLYKRYIDFNSDKVLTALKQMDELGRETTFEKLVQDPNGWAKAAFPDRISSEARATALRLRDDFAMSPSQKEISAHVIQSRLRIVWGPPGSGKTEFLALFLVWYITHLHQDNGRPLLIGVTAFTRHAIMNLLERVSIVRNRHQATAATNFEIISMGSDSRKLDDMILCKAEQLRKEFQALGGKAKAVVVGGTVWDWYKVKNKWQDKHHWKGCDMMIIDESSQLLAADAALAIDCIDEKKGRLIIAGDHMQLGPILQNVYPKLPIKEPLLFGSIQQCLMRTKDNHAIRLQDFLLKKGVTPDFGPNTIQLRDNWRMNEELNSFFKQIYGSDLWARYPKLRLYHDWTKINGIYNSKVENCIRLALDPSKSITIVRVPKSSEQPENGYDVFSETETEAQIVADIVNAHLTARLDPEKKPVSSMLKSEDKPHVLIVTPHHRQRLAVERRLKERHQIGFKVNTVEKMQGQECELVIACFAFRAITDTRVDFLLDFKRWNVAASRARCKVILITTEDLLDMPNSGGHKRLEIFKNPGSADGWGFVCMLEEWARKTGSIIDWATEDESSET